MKLIAPDYYREFRCIADKCRHTCCVGWEIDVDEDSLARYHAVPGEIGRRLRESIVEDEGGAHFRLTREERCPFLNPSGLCDLITALGEDSLCQICADHPRYRSFYSDRTEIGLGLCCEEAARLILTREAPMRLICLEDDGQDDPLWEEDAALLSLRDELLALAQDRSRSVRARVQAIAARSGAAPVHLPDWVDFLLSLERLDDAWADRLQTLRAPRRPAATDPRREIALEQLLVTLLYRHLPGALEDGMTFARVDFCLLCWQLIDALAGPDVDELIDVARMFSSEMEYSDENIAAMLEKLDE